MTTITESNTYPAAINRYDTTDPVLGGETGESNNPIIALTNRTNWLHNYLAGFAGFVNVSSSITIGLSYLRKLITINASSNIILTLDAAGAFLPGQALHFKCINAGVKCVSIVAGGSDVILDGNTIRKIWLYNGESVTLVAGTGGWMVMDLVGNHDNVGNDALVRKLPRNSIIANGNVPESSGTLLSRADYARLWDAVSDTAISDATWLSDTVNYRSYFSAGNGTTTFRLPDMRSMFLRGLDLGRGLAFTRIGSDAGAYEADSIKAHGHAIRTTNTDPSLNPNADPIRGTINGSVNTSGAAGGGTIASAGGAENLVKNIGLIPIIYF
jgi:hypothetical protein